jgi:hypothetical protein
MPKYLFAYTGGGVPESEEAQADVMTAWTAWYEKLGSAIVDPGNPTGPSVTVASDGSVSQGGKGGLSGYTIVTARRPRRSDLDGEGLPCAHRRRRRRGL